MNRLGFGGTVLTGELVAAAYRYTAVVNDVAVGLNIAELEKIKVKLKFYQSKLKESLEKEKEFELELEKKYIQIQQKFIPIKVE